MKLDPSSSGAQTGAANSKVDRTYTSYKTSRVHGVRHPIVPTYSHSLCKAPLALVKTPCRIWCGEATLSSVIPR